MNGIFSLTPLKFCLNFNSLTECLRLRKAARRTLRAEATLIIVIVLITTWSIYGLYKLSIGSSDTFMGLSFRAADQSIETRTASNNQASDSSTNDSTQQKVNNSEIKQRQQIVAASQPSETSNQKLTYSQPNEANQLQNILQQLYSSSSKLRDTNDLGINPNNIRLVNSIDEHLKLQLNDQKLNPLSLSSNDHFKDLRRGYKLPSNLEDILDQDKKSRATDLLPHIYGNNHSNNGISRLPISFPSLMQLGAEAAKANKNVLRPKNEQIESTFPDILPDYGDELNDKVIKDDGSFYDRVPAESNRDSSESSIKSDYMESQTTPGAYNYEDNQPQQDTESNTAQPNYEEPEQSQAGDNQDGSQDDSQSPVTSSEAANSDINDSDNEESSKASNDDEANQQPDGESTKETSQSIDEEVDKMTQPTSGMVSQQDRPFDYKNTVQFDDSPPTPMNGSVLRQTNRRSTSGVLEPGNLIARFEDPNSETDRLKEEISKQRDPPDLQVDHNTKATGIDSLSDPNRREKGLKRVKHLEDGSNRRSYHSSSPNYRLNRQSRSIMGIEKIRAPYEFDKFLDSLNFDSLTGQSSSTDLIRREPKSLDLNSSDSRNSTTVDRYAYNSAAEDGNTKQPHIVKQNFREPSKIDEIDRRNFFDDELADLDNNKTAARKLAASHYYDPDPDIVNSPNSQYYRNDTSSNNPSKIPDKSRYHYLTSNDTGIQELLDKKSLFSSLGSDELPPPAEKPEILPKSKPSSNVIDNQQGSGKNDHQAEDSLFSVDHGLLLYPSADEEHHHKEKSISKKHRKSDKKKEKKKMTVAIKKGGHKKKKHKKEMKKFLKEKKFKGAKKGKKVAKGKGGQGGKKGKKLYKDKGFKKKGFKNVYHKEEFGQKKSYFDEYRDKDFKKKWKKFDDKYNYAQMKKWQAKDVKHAKKKKDHGEKHKKYDKGKWKKKYEKHSKEHSEKHMKKKKKSHKFK